MHIFNWGEKIISIISWNSDWRKQVNIKAWFSFIHKEHNKLQLHYWFHFVSYSEKVEQTESKVIMQLNAENFNWYCGVLLSKQVVNHLIINYSLVYIEYFIIHLCFAFLIKGFICITLGPVLALNF